MYKSAMTKLLARLISIGHSGLLYFIHTQVWEHASENGERSGGLLV